MRLSSFTEKLSLKDKIFVFNKIKLGDKKQTAKDKTIIYHHSTI